MRHKTDAAETFKQFLSDACADGVPSQVRTVRSAGGGVFLGGKFGDLCRSRCIKQEFTTCADGVPSQVRTVRSAGGGVFFGGKFGDLCGSRCIKQEFTTAGSPQINGVAERALYQII